MPHNPHDALPDDVRTQLPPPAQEVYRQAFAEAWTSYGRSSRDESRAHALAWAAVKAQYHRNERGEWEAGAPEGNARHSHPIDSRRIF